MGNNNCLALPFGDKVGAYETIIRASKPIINHGDRVQFEIYISGYGQITNACIGIYPSWAIFDIAESKVRTGDSDWVPMDPLAVIISLGNESFFDAKGKYQISTECRTPPPHSAAPINLDMKVGKKAPSGTYSMHVALKYFNGECWDTRTSSSSIHIRNFYQKHETLVWIVGGVAAFLSIISSIFPLVQWILKRIWEIA